MSKKVSDISTLSTVSIADIDRHDRTFSLRYATTTDRALARSIKELGQLQPVILVKKGKKYKIVAGFTANGQALKKRAEAFVSTGDN